MTYHPLAVLFIYTLYGASELRMEAPYIANPDDKISYILLLSISHLSLSPFVVTLYRFN